VNFAIAIPQFVEDGSFDPAALREFLRAAEEFGFESGWTQEQVLGDFPDLAPMETLAWAAAATTRLRLGCSVLVSTLHSPLHLALSIATVDHLSGGRLEVGLGSGGGHRQFAAFGVDPATYIARFIEGLALMKRLWTEERVDAEGRFWQLTNAAMEPSRTSARGRRSGSVAPTRRPCAARWRRRTASSVRARRPRRPSPARWTSCGPSWPRLVRTRARSGSPSGST
jgi:alkanesulfonate monooxygenase SsuD/methylene tetrahydromethanopterin reductase-like flavin-dependent oxidoreductase (luciferase family)